MFFFSLSPRLTPGEDRNKCHREVSHWVNFVTQRAASSDKAKISEKDTMGSLLIESIHTYYQAVVQYAIESSEIVLDHQTDQEQAVKKIVEFVGQYSPVEATKRIFSAYNKMYASDSQTSYIPSLSLVFRGLASEYMNLAVTSSTDKKSQLIEIFILEYANIDENTNNTIKIQLVAKAEQTDKESIPETIKNRRVRRDEIVKKLDDVLSSTVPGSYHVRREYFSTEISQLSD